MDIDVGGHRYRLGKLDAREQLHIYRRIAPIVAVAGGIDKIQNIRQAAVSGSEEGVSLDQVGAFAGMLAPFLTALAAVPDADIDFIIDTCLRHVMREADGGSGWAPVFRGAIMFDDIGLMAMLELAGRVVIGSPGSGGIGDFFSARPPT